MSDAGSFSCRRFRVTGRVQGVFFRASTRDVAIGLELTGHARNLSDGSVEVLACGRGAAIDQLAQWLKRGPRMATVDRLEVEQLEFKRINGFSIG